VLTSNYNRLKNVQSLYGVKQSWDAKDNLHIVCVWERDAPLSMTRHYCPNTNIMIFLNMLKNSFIDVATQGK